MPDSENALPLGGPAKPTQISHKTYEIDRRDRLLLAGVLLFCFLAVDSVWWSWPWGAGLTVTVFVWYALLLSALGTALFRSQESRCLLLVNLALAASFALGSNPYFRWWNFLALLVLVPLHACGLSDGAKLPWRQPAMVWERVRLFFGNLFGALGAPFAALTPQGKGRDPKRLLSVTLGAAGALVLLAVLVPVLASADALFAEATADLRLFIQVHFTETLGKLLFALVLTPFAFSLLYRLRRPAPAKAAGLKSFTADGALFLIVLAALDALYLLFLLVQSAGLFGGDAYLARRGISYAEWARSGFFQMAGVTAVNLTVTLAAVGLSRRVGRSWTAVRILSTLLGAESLVLLASAFWRMSLYVSVYGLSFKRCMTYWGMAVMALLLLAALWKVGKPDASFCRSAFPLVLAGWLFINCVPIDALVARSQVNRYLSGESSQLSVEYLVGLSYGTLPSLERLEGMSVLSNYGVTLDMDSVLAACRGRALAECGDWRTWNLSACFAAGRAS